MYEVIGEVVKSATSIKLGEIFGTTIKRYKESVTNIQYPNFFIYVVSSSITKDTRNRWFVDYLMNIRYRVVKDVETITNLEQQLDGIGFDLLTQFTEIQLERPVRVTNARYEKADGVLQFFYNVRIRIKRELTPDATMEVLTLLEQLKEKEEALNTEETNNQNTNDEENNENNEEEE